ncbi:hypothetical protein MCOR25_001139, partial [Pyricularia grisea]
MLLLVELGFANTFCSAVSIKAMWLRVSYVSLPSTICLNNAFKPTPRSSQTSMSGFPPIEPFPLLKKTPRAPTWHRETTPEIIGLIFHFILGLSLGGNELSETKKKKKNLVCWCRGVIWIFLSSVALFLRASKFQPQGAINFHRWGPEAGHQPCYTVVISFPKDWYGQHQQTGLLCPSIYHPTFLSIQHPVMQTIPTMHLDITGPRQTCLSRVQGPPDGLCFVHHPSPHCASVRDVILTLSSSLFVICSSPIFTNPNPTFFFFACTRNIR